MTEPAGPSPLVLRAITRMNIGGPARQALLLTEGLRPRFRTTLVAGAPSEVEGELVDPAVPVRRVPLHRPLRPVDDARAVAAIRRIMVQERPAIAHSHMAKAGTVTRIAASTLGRRRPKTVHTFHGHVLDGYFTPTVQRAFTLAERALARRTDVLIAISDEVRTSLLELGIGRPEQYRTIPLGLDLRRHAEVTGPSGALRAHIGIGPDELLLGIVGRLVPIKDVGTTLEAVARVPGVHLAVVGDGESRPELEQRATDLGLVGRVHFTGWWHDVPAAMADLDLVVLSSLNEGTPVALIEASACGRAAVASDVGGVRSVVHDGETGLLVPASDPSALAEAISALAADPARRAAMGEAARSVAAGFGHERLLADIRALYEELVAG